MGARLGTNDLLRVTPSWPQANRAVHQRFVEVEGWDAVPSRHHDTHELVLPTGEVLRTRISRPPSKKHTYGPGMWRHILREQLVVSEAEFWACVNDARVPDRGAADGAPPEAIPAEVATLLVERVGLTERQVKRLTRAQAIERLNQFWTTGE